MAYAALAQVLVFVALISLSGSAPQQRADEVKITRYENEPNDGNAYSFAYELSDGTKREERGEIKNAGTDNEVLVVRGSYSFMSPDGEEYTVEFVADENGYHPKTAKKSGGRQESHPALALPAAAIASLVG